MANFTLLPGGGLSYLEILYKLCRIFKNSGVSVIISEGSSLHSIQKYLIFIQVTWVSVLNNYAEDQAVKVG